MKRLCNQAPASRVLKAVAMAACFVSMAGTVKGQARVDGIGNPAAASVSFAFTAKAGEISTPDGSSIHFWGFQDNAGHNGQIHGGPLPQYPGPTLILSQGQTVSIQLSSALPYNQCTSMVFPGHSVTATGGDQNGLLARETCVAGTPVTYSFTAAQPGTYSYHTGTQVELQIEMGLVGAIIVRPAGNPAWAYDHPDTWFTHEYLFMTTSLDPLIHKYAEQGRFNEIDMSAYFPVYWFFNGRAAPDDMFAPYIPSLPHQPYNCSPRMVPGDRVLQRMVSAGLDQHPIHFHGNHYQVIARNGRLLSTDPLGGAAGPGPNLQRSQFTTTFVPGQTYDGLFEWTGAKLGWDIYGSTADGMPGHNCVDLVNNRSGAPGPDGYADAGSDHPWEYCADHNKRFPVILPGNQNLMFGGWWSGSPYMGGSGDLPPGEGGLNPYSGFFFMWHSHREKELTNFDIFPGGLFTMMVVEPPGTPIP